MSWDVPVDRWGGDELERGNSEAKRAPGAKKYTQTEPGGKRLRRMWEPKTLGDVIEWSLPGKKKWKKNVKVRTSSDVVKSWSTCLVPHLIAMATLPARKSRQRKEERERKRCSRDGEIVGERVKEWLERVKRVSQGFGELDLSHRQMQICLWAMTS